MSSAYRCLRRRMGFAYFWWWRFWLFLGLVIFRICHAWLPGRFLSVAMNACASIGRLELPQH